MNEQYPGGATGGPGHDAGAGGTGPHSSGPNPFSREGAGDGAGLGPDPDPSSSEPSGFVGQPGGPTPDTSATPYSPASSADPYGSGTYTPDYSSGGYEAPYAPPAGAGQPQDPYSAPSASNPASPADPGQGYGTPASYGAGQPAYPPNPYDTGGYRYAASPYGYPTEQHAQGTTALVLGILGVTVCPPAGVVGFVISSKARKEVQAAPGRYSNSGMVTAGWVLGIIAIVATAFWVLYLVVVIIAVIASGVS